MLLLDVVRKYGSLLIYNCCWRNDKIRGIINGILKRKRDI